MFSLKIVFFLIFFILVFLALLRQPRNRIQVKFLIPTLAPPNFLIDPPENIFLPLIFQGNLDLVHKLKITPIINIGV